MVVGATNRPDCVDPALLRPGRFDRLLYVSPPDAAARQAILAVHTRNTPLAPNISLQVTPSLHAVSCHQCQAETFYYSGNQAGCFADIQSGYQRETERSRYSIEHGMDKSF